MIIYSYIELYINFVHICGHVYNHIYVHTDKNDVKLKREKIVSFD